MFFSEILIVTASFKLMRACENCATLWFKTVQIHPKCFPFSGNVSLVPYHKVKRRQVIQNRHTHPCLIVIQSPQDQRFMIRGEKSLDYTGVFLLSIRTEVQRNINIFPSIYFL